MNQFEKDLMHFVTGTIGRRKKLHFGNPSLPLQLAGVPPYPMKLNQSVVRKILEKHELSVAQLIQVQAALNSPLMIFKSASVPAARLLLTPIPANEKSIVIAIHPGGKMGQTTVSEVKSIHPRPAQHILLWMENGLLIAADKQKCQPWLEDRSRYNSERYLAMAGRAKPLISEQQSQGKSRGIRL